MVNMYSILVDFYINGILGSGDIGKDVFCYLVVFVGKIV